jgi:hypothetical protein
MLLGVNKRRQGTHVSANTMRVRLAFSIVNLVFPSCPAIRPEMLFLSEECAIPCSYTNRLLG